MNQYLKQAINLALKANPSPNPRVGCVIVKKGRVIGSGYHRKTGMPHAEIEALRSCRNARGAVMFVTLEPCCFQGKTPACTRAIIKAGIKQVVIGMLDPNPKVNGRGVRELRHAGVYVQNMDSAECKAINKAYIKHITTGLPYVILKAGMTLDGKIATKTGESKFITCEKSQEYVHLIRANVDAVLVGINTVFKDNPRLNTRLVKGNSPIKIIVDSNLTINENSKALKKGTTILATHYAYDMDKVKRFKERKNIILLKIKEKNARVDLTNLMITLGKMGITSIMIEGGAEINASALREGLVDKFMFFIAPKIMTGKDGFSVFGGEGVDKLEDVFKIKNMKCRQIGDDLLVEGER